MRIGGPPGSQPIVARSFLPVSNGLFVLPDAGVKPSRLIAASRTFAQVGAVERVQVKAVLHDKLFAAREGVASVAAGAVAPEDVGQAAQAFNSYLEALDGGNMVDRSKAGELRTAIAEVHNDFAAIGVGIVHGKLAPNFDRLAQYAQMEPELVSDVFDAVQSRLDPVFARQSESLAVEQETAQARIPFTQASAAVGAALAGLSLKTAKLTSILGRMDSVSRAKTLQGARLRRLAAVSMPRPMVPGTTLPGFPALGRPTGYRDGAEFEMLRRTPGLAPGSPTVSAGRADGVPAFEKPRPAELHQPGSDPGAPPEQKADVAKVVREIDRVKAASPVSAKVQVPGGGFQRRVTAEGKPISAFRKLRSVEPKSQPQTKPKEAVDRFPGPPPVENPDKKGGTPQLPPVTQDSVPVQKQDKIPKNPGQALKDLLPKKPLPPVTPGEGEGKDRGEDEGDDKGKIPGQQQLEPGRTNGPALPAPPK